MAERKTELQELAAERIRLSTADSIYGRYVPRNMEDCFLQLDKMLTPKARNGVKHAEAAGNSADLHFGLGLNLRNAWGLWGSSRLKRYFNSRGIRVTDMMSDAIIRSYSSWLNGNVAAAAEWEAAHPETNPGQQ